MKKINTRNKNGVKNCDNFYRIINGIEYEQWTDDISIDIKKERKEYPNYKFIKRGERIYRSL